MEPVSSGRRMLKTLRTYRSLAALLAGTLFLASAMPLIEHACAMAGLPTISTLLRCCCDEDAHAGMAMPGMPCPHDETFEGLRSTDEAPPSPFEEGSLPRAVF